MAWLDGPTRGRRLGPAWSRLRGEPLEDGVSGHSPEDEELPHMASTLIDRPMQWEATR